MIGYRRIIISHFRVNTAKVTFKIALLGDGAVGKTSLRKRYIGEGFSHQLKSIYLSCNCPKTLR
ncbi:MAG: hypothetical protein ACXAC2_25535 [Candidatus Kariarchaeaceae archaeon]